MKKIKIIKINKVSILLNKQVPDNPKTKRVNKNKFNNQVLIDFRCLKLRKIYRKVIQFHQPVKSLL
jgi:hypothetical protein